MELSACSPGGLAVSVWRVLPVVLAVLKCVSLEYFACSPGDLAVSVWSVLPVVLAVSVWSVLSVLMMSLRTKFACHDGGLGNGLFGVVHLLSIFCSPSVILFGNIAVSHVYFDGYLSAFQWKMICEMCGKTRCVFLRGGGSVCVMSVL